MRRDALQQRDQALQLARPGGYYFDALDEDVREAIDKAITRLVAAGVNIVDVDVPEAKERETIFPTVLASEFIATFGRDRFNAEHDGMDPLISARAAKGLTIAADQYILAIARHRQLVREAADRMEGRDGWISPTTALPGFPTCL